MKVIQAMTRKLCAPVAVALALGLAPAVHADNGAYQQRNLVSDVLAAEHTDPNLANAWGIAFNPFGPAWVADNHTGVSTLYDGNGNIVPLVVHIPAPGSPTGGGSPTGIVFNANPATPLTAAANFFVSGLLGTGPSKFIFATEDGLIAGWSPTADGTHAIQVRDDSLFGAVYKGLALSANGTGARLYATDFHNNRVAVFDNTFAPVSMPSGAFTDPKIPAGFAPFGVQAINGDIYISYAKQNAAGHDDVAGNGNGFINVFDPNGQLIRRVVKRGKLNSPWGIALAPAGFGRFSNHLLVGNFGDGRISAYDLATGEFKGQLQAPNGAAIQIEKLWGLAFGNGFANQPVNTLFFAAGPNDEVNGLYGRLDPIPDPKDDKEDHED